MSFPGWMVFAGTEIINVARTVTYSANLMPTLSIGDCYGCDDLNVALDDPPYTDPVTDAAPWYDPDQPETAEFLGLYPVSVRGLDGATTSATVGESTGDGGFVSSPRRMTREITVDALLVGTSQAGSVAGMSWLKSVLRGNECGTCEGDSICFFAHCPTLDGATTDTAVDAAVLPVLRHLRNVTAVEGPIPTQERNLSCGGYFIRVEFTFVAATPHVYTEPVTVATQSGTSLLVHQSGASIFPITPIGVPAPKAKPKPLVDPDCPVIPPVPLPPALPSACGTQPSAFYSYAIYIPETSVQSWREGVVQLEMTTGPKPTRFARVRMLPRPLPGQTPLDLNPDSACGSFMVNYIPANTTVRLDGMTERVTFTVGNADPVSGEHLVSGVGTEMFQWPLLTCGIGYYVIIDTDTAARFARVSLATANRE